MMELTPMLRVCLLSSLLFQLIQSQNDHGMVLNWICQAKCLEDFKISTSNQGNYDGEKDPFLIESFCFNDAKCKGCNNACAKYDNSQQECKDSCKALQEKSSQETCRYSCDFIESKKVNRPGLCPTNAALLKCPYPCQKDSDCFKQGTKCCKSVSCGNTCQIAQLPTTDVPPVPLAPIVRQSIDKKDRDQINFDLEWSTYDISGIKYPVLFLVQIRIGQRDKDQRVVYGMWRDLIATTKSGVIISSIYPENWYQFRLLAYSKNGYKNYGEMTQPITVQYKPTYPKSPRNITEKVSRIVDRKISVTLTWQAGEANSLVPISNYKINWRRFHEMYESSPLLPEFEIVIPATDTTYTIQDLAPSTTYRIMITAVLIYKGAKYNSTGAVHYVTTSAIPNSIAQQLESKTIDETKVDACACENSYEKLPVVIDNATVHNGKLTMHVKLKDGIEFDSTFAPYSFRIGWSPIACIESNSWRVDSKISDLPQSVIVNDNIDNYITGLRVQCSYRIEIELISLLANKKIKIWDGCFCTPNCAITDQQNTAKTSICPKAADQNMPPGPQNIRISLHKSENDSTASAQLQWDSNPANHITAFRITWGPRLYEPIDEHMYSKEFMPLIDSSKAMSKVVKYPLSTLTLRYLDANQIYVVKLQSLNGGLSSQENVMTFKVSFDNNSSNVPRYQSHIVLLALFLMTVSLLL